MQNLIDLWINNNNQHKGRIVSERCHQLQKIRMKNRKWMFHHYQVQEEHLQVSLILRVIIHLKEGMGTCQKDNLSFKKILIKALAIQISQVFKIKIIMLMSWRTHPIWVIFQGLVVKYQWEILEQKTLEIIKWFKVHKNLNIDKN